MNLQLVLISQCLQEVFLLSFVLGQNGRETQQVLRSAVDIDMPKMVSQKCSPVPGPSPAQSLELLRPGSTEVELAAAAVGTAGTAMGGKSPIMACRRVWRTSAVANFVKPSATMSFVG